MARIDLILPAYNAGATLDEALASLWSQTYPDWRALVLDDGSTDATREIAHAWAARDPRFQVIPLPHQGLVATLNEGLGRARAPLVGRMDADERCEPDRLAAQARLLEAGVDVASCAIGSFKSDGRPPGWGMQRYVAWVNSLITPADHFRERFVESPVAHSSILAPRDLLAPGYRETDWSEDYDLWLRLLHRGARFAKVDRVLLHVRDDPRRLSRTDRHYTQAALRRCKIHHLLGPQGPLARRPPTVLWGAGRVGKRWLRELPAHGLPLQAAVDLHPRKIGRRIHGTPIISPDGLPPLLARLGRDPPPVILGAVGAPGARPEIRAYLQGLGLSEPDDFLFVA